MFTKKFLEGAFRGIGILGKTYATSITGGSQIVVPESTKHGFLPPCFA